MKKLFKSGLLAAVALFCIYSKLYSVPFPAPSVSAPAKLGTISAANGNLPSQSPINYETAFTNPYPTNKWFTPLITKAVNDMRAHRTYTQPFNMLFDGLRTSIAGMVRIDTSENKAEYYITRSDDIYIPVQIMVDGILHDSNAGTTLTVCLSTYTDWSVTVKRFITGDPSLWYTVQIGRGMPFFYFKFADRLTARLEAREGDSYKFYTPSGAVATSPYIGDRILVYVKDYYDNNHRWFAVYAPENSTFTFGGALRVDFAPGRTGAEERYLIIASISENAGTVAPATADAQTVDIFNDMYKYAYNFPIDTKVSYNVDHANAKVKTTFNYTFDRKRTGGVFEEGTYFLLFPHQWKNLAATSPSVLTGTEYRSIRGKMKVGKGTSFEIENNFNGILPNLPYKVPDANREQLAAYFIRDRNFDFTSTYVEPIGTLSPHPYYSGKLLARVANLVPIFHQMGEYDSRDALLARLKSELGAWFKNEAGGDGKVRGFAYDANYWGGINAYAGSRDSAYHEPHNYNDHHFNHGYFLFASAIVQMFDPTFKDSYGSIIKLLIKDIANPKRNDPSFPFMRYLDVYSGHSWASGMAGWNDFLANNSVNQESSSEAMNAWGAVYLWGLVSGDDIETESGTMKIADLGIYCYTTEYTGIQEYYFDLGTQGQYNYADFTNYANKSIGILWDKSLEYYVLWRDPYPSGWGSNPPKTEEVTGIQVLPLSPTMLYLGYDAALTNKAYMQDFYSAMVPGGLSGALPTYWQDICLRYKALFDGEGALADWKNANLSYNSGTNLKYPGSDEGSTLTYSYHFINFFNELGTVSTKYYADTPSFCVMEKGAVNTYIAFNPTDVEKTVNFYPRVGGGAIGQMKVPAKTTVSTNDFISFKYDSLGYLYQHIGDKWEVLISASAADFSGDPKIALAAATKPAIDDPWYDYLGAYFTLSKNDSVTINNAVDMVFTYNISLIPAGISEDDVRLAYLTAAGEIEVINSAPNTSNHTITVDIREKGAGTYLFVYPRATPKEMPMYVFPSPYRPSKHGNTGITFVNVSAGTKIRIYNIAGEKIFDVTVDSVGADRRYTWNVRNNSNNKIASGVYIYYIENNGKTKKGKFVIER